VKPIFNKVKGAKVGSNAIVPVTVWGVGPNYLKAKEELWKLKYFTKQKYIIFKNILYKKPKSFRIL
jgi:hypothetical protein